MTEVRDIEDVDLDQDAQPKLNPDFDGLISLDMLGLDGMEI